MTGTSPLERTRSAPRPIGTWRLALVAVSSLLLAFCGSLAVASADETPPPVVLDLSEGIGVGSGAGSVEGVLVDSPEAVRVADVHGAITGALVAQPEGVGVSDVHQVHTGVSEAMAEGVGVSEEIDVEVIGGADLSVAVSAEPDPVNAGATLTYTVTLANAGPSAADAARFTIEVPSDLTFVSADGGFDCAPDEGGLLCQSTQGASFSLASGASTLVHLVFDVAEDATGPLVATITALTDTADLDADNDTATVSTVVNRAPSVTPPDDQTVEEGAAATIGLGGFTDGSDDGPWTVTIDWGDGSPIETLTVGTAGALAAGTHTYAEGPAEHTVVITVTDRWDLTGEATFTVEVLNVAPTPEIAGAPGSSPEGTEITLSGSATDPSAQDTDAGFTFTWIVTRDGAPFVAGSGDSLAFTPDDDGTYAVELTATDKDGGSGSTALAIAVTNVAPAIGTLTLDPASIDEDGTVTLTGSFTDPAALDTHEVVIDWADGSAPTVLTLAIGERTFSASHRYLDDPSGTPDVYTIGVTVTDDDGGTAAGSAEVTVLNVAPTPEIAGAPGSGPEGTAITLTGLAIDPSPVDTAAGFTFSWTVTKEGAPFAAGSGDSFTFTPDDEGTYAVELTATDKDGGSGSSAVEIAATNAAPAIGTLTLDQASIDEAGTVTLTGTITDPGSLDTHTVVIDWGDGGATRLTLALGERTFSASHRYLDDDPSGTALDIYAIAVTVSDDGDTGAGLTAVTVRNVAPVLGPIAAPAAPQAVGTMVSASAPFSDIGTLDTHTGTWDWGDGTSSAATIGAGIASGTHTYVTAGVYPITLTLTDDDTGAATAVFQYVIVSDPSASITGGGHFTSPVGALATDPQWDGRATFGFTARYVRGHSVPTGSTELQLQGKARLNFKSTAYEWLLVAGPRALLRGTGTVNGTGSYGFLLTTVDGRPGAGGGGDRIRIKIWDRSTGSVVYDSGLGADELAPPPTTLGGGSIAHH